MAMALFYVEIREMEGLVRGSNVLVGDDNYIYYKNPPSSFRCRLHQGGCRAGLHLDDAGRYNVTDVHSHGNEAAVIRKMELLAECKRRAAETFLRPRQIFNEVRRTLFPDVVMGFTQAVERSMQRARVANQPGLPRTRARFEQLLLANERYMNTLDGVRFYNGRVRTQDGEDSAFIFINPTLLPRLRDADEVHSDGTFGMVPPLFYQLFTLHIIQYGKMFPVAYALMSAKTQELYGLVMQNIMAAVQRLAPGENSVRLMISDYEEAILNTMRATFPNGRERGCWFHFGQAIYRYVCERAGLKVAYDTRPAVKKIIKMFIALALLPAARIAEGLETIRQRYDQLLAVETEEVRSAMDDVIEYMGGYWMMRVGPARISVFQDVNRTNNGVESFNHTFSLECGGVRPNPWAFINHLQNNVADMTHDFGVLQAGGQIRRPREPRQRNQNRDIARISNQLAENEIQIYEFLEVAANFFEPAPVLPPLPPRNDEEGGVHSDTSDDDEDSDDDDEAGAPLRGAGRGRRRGHNQGRQRGHQRGGHPRLRYRNAAGGRVGRVGRVAAVHQAAVHQAAVHQAVAGFHGQEAPPAPAVANEANHGNLANGGNQAAPVGTCNICTIDPINRFILPCGHTLCQNCSVILMEERRCFVCRTPVENVFPLYL